MRWGLIPYNTKDWKTVQQKDKSGWYKNAKAEKVFDTWPYKLSIEHKRCIIPSTGYFEPHYNPDGTKAPYYAHLPENRNIFHRRIMEQLERPGHRRRYRILYNDNHWGKRTNEPST